MQRPLLPILAFAVLSLASCQKETSTNPSTALEGTWRLVKRQCYCAPSSLPNETLTFTATTFAFHRLGPQPVPASALFMSGNYQFAAVTLCGLPTASAGLRLTDAVANIGPREVQYTLQADTLILDYGGPCDASVDIYERQQ